VLFNPYIRPLVPGFRVRPQNDGLGFNLNENSSASARAWPDGMPPGRLTPRWPDAAPSLAQPILGFPTLSPALLAQSASPVGLPAFHARPQADVPGLKLRLEDAVPGFNLVGSGGGVQRQETTWSDATRAESARPQYSDTVPTPTPSSVEDSPQPVPPQLPEWLYKLVTLPLPQSSTAFDPRTGRRVVPYAPLIGSVRSVEPPGAEPRPSSDTPAGINTGSGAATAQNANPEPTPRAAIWNARPQPSKDGWPHAQADGAERQVPWPAATMPQPIGIPDTVGQTSCRLQLHPCQRR
jgi:hypothetical protein